jgi:TPR repeat protein
MEDYALNQGEPPAILYRSGRISEEGIRVGRLNIQGMLGFLYVSGLTLEKDLAKAALFLLAAAQGGNGTASNALANHLSIGSWPAEQAAPLCRFLHQTPAQTTRINAVNLKAALESDTCKAVLGQ